MLSKRKTSYEGGEFGHSSSLWAVGKIISQQNHLLFYGQFLKEKG